MTKETLAARNGAELIRAERERQISQEGWTAEHDEAHDLGELGKAAASYIWHSRAQDYANSTQGGRLVKSPPRGWPWDVEWWKPSTDPIHDLVKAGALIAAEIDRMIRARSLPEVTQ